MRSKIWPALLVLGCTALVTSAASAQTPALKFGYINSTKIMAEAPGRVEAEAQFDKEVAAYRTQLQRMSDSLQTLDSVFQRESPKLDSLTRETRRKSIADREANYQQRAQQLNEQMQNRQGELVRPIMEQIQKIIESVRAEDHYAIIFDVGSQGNAIVAADKTLDVTDKVIARLKAAAPAAKPASGLNPQPAGVVRK